MRLRAANGCWDVALEPAVSGYTIEWAEPDFFLLTRGELLYQARSLQGPFTRLGAYPGALWKRGIRHLRPLQRLLRHMYYNVLRLPNGDLFLTFARSIGVYADGRLSPLGGIARPCRVLRAGCAVDKHGDVYFGEYLANRDRHPVHIYRYTPGNRHVDVVYTFPAGAIRHVHGVYHDPYTDALWCVAGDKESECRMLRTNDGFQTLEVIGKGDETWRCVSLLFTDGAVYYSMDAEFVSNWIYRIDRHSGRRDVLGRVDGPVYYSYAFGKELFFAVTAELCPSQQGRSASLWHISAGGDLQRVFAVEKDWLPVKYFMPGTLHFPRGPGLATEFYFHCVGLSAADNRTYRVRRQPV
jgi:hypothetical protein